MSEFAFRSIVLSYMSKSGIALNKVDFHINNEKGLFSAIIPSEELRISARPGSMMLTIRTDNGHQFMAPAAV